jgi:DNA invertase Pin-like site-specific DNA recombinase
LFYLWNSSAGQLAKLLSGGKMDVTKILTELRQEREQIEEAIMSLERLARGRGRRRGRPPAWMAELDKKRGRPPGSKNKNTNVQKAVGLA